MKICKIHQILAKNSRKCSKVGAPPFFSPKNKCVLNDSKWPETQFGTFFLVCEKLLILPPYSVKFLTLFLGGEEDFPKTKWEQ